MPRASSRSARNRKNRDVGQKVNDEVLKGASGLKPCDRWVETIDVLEVERDFNELGRELAKQQGPADVAHLKKIILWSQILSVSGLLSMVLSPSYIFPALLLSTATFIRWTCIGHHVCHGGYNNCVPKGSRFDRFKFALGSALQRLRDWPDWMLPEAWNFEHNHLHHYALNEDIDPDLVEQNLSNLRALNIPIIFKYIFTVVNAMTWKWFYYASNTYASLKAHEDKPGQHAPMTTLINMYFNCNLPKYISKIEFSFRVLFPYVLYQFVLLPLPLLAGAMIASKQGHHEWSEWLMNAHWNATINMLLSDVITNVHSFIVIVTNHAGEDMYRWRTHAAPLSGAFYIRAIVSSANYSAGNDYVDVLHGWLNYQAEHHCFPKLSMLSYQKAMPRVKELAKKHGIPYTQENVFIRLKKTVDSMCGTTTMREVPMEYEERLNVTMKTKLKKK